MNAMAPRVSWVVYRMSPLQSPIAGIVVCQQNEWESMEKARPGYHTIIQGGIPSEAEAEKLARSHSQMRPLLPITLQSRL